MAIHKLNAPLKIERPRTKPFHLNLNIYRNAHFHTLNNMKVKYKELMADQINQLPQFQHPIMIKYVVYPADARLCDISNICSVQSKFFCDALVEAGKLIDDNYKHVVEERNAFGNIDRQRPRVTIYIKELIPEENPC